MTLVWIIATIVFLIIAFAVGFNIWKSSFNHKIRIRRITSDKTKVVRDAIAKTATDKEKIPYLYVWFGFKRPLPNKLPLPPARAVNYDSQSNKLVVECWYDSERGYTYITDDVSPDFLDKSEEANKFGVLPTNQREMMVNQIYKRDSRKVANWAQFFTNATPFIALIMILTIFLIFFGKAVQPISNMAATVGEQYQSITTAQASIMDKQNLLFTNLINYAEGRPLISGEQEVPPEG